MSKNISYSIYLGLLFSFGGCATLFDDFDKKLLDNKEFDQQVQIKEIPAETAPADSSVSVQTGESSKSSRPGAQSSVSPKDNKNANANASNSKENNNKENGKKEGAISENTSTNENNKSATDAKSGASASGPAAKIQKHLPPIEDSEGFNGRRPIEDPFVVGEVSELSLSYFGVEAGRLKISIKPFVEVNGKKSYHFSYEARSSSVFSMFYSVDDRADTYMDYEQLVPYSYTISAKESKQVRDVKSYSNWKTMKAKTWDKKIKKGKEAVIQDYSWDIDPYAQNVFSVAFYLRCFVLKVGKKLAVNVAHEGKNIVMTAEIVRQEKLSTPIGKLDTFVVKPSFEIDGVFKPVGDVFLWVTNDKYKRLVRIESKIKIGKVVAAIEKITP